LIYGLCVAVRKFRTALLISIRPYSPRLSVIQINDYELSDSMVKDNERTGSLKNVRTRLNCFIEKEQGHLINWGYALTDTALRRWYFKEPQEPGDWPIPQYAL